MGSAVASGLLVSVLYTGGNLLSHAKVMGIVVVLQLRGGFDLGCGR
jgi:hypothetical protein